MTAITGAIYVCPTCGEKMERDLLLFIRHTDAHVVEELKKKNPKWITDDGYCPKCLEHYKASLRGDEVLANIGGAELTKRRVVAVAGFLISLALFFALGLSGAPRFYRLFLFLPLFAACFGSFQAQKNHCVILGMKGARNMGHGEEPLTDEALKNELRRESSRILFVSLVAASALTAAGYFLG